MTSPDLIHELTATRPAAPTALRTRVREIAAQEAAPKASFWPQLRLPVRRIALVAVPTAATIAIASSAVLGLARSDSDVSALRERGEPVTSSVAGTSATALSPPPATSPLRGTWGPPRLASCAVRLRRIRAP